MSEEIKRSGRGGSRPGAGRKMSDERKAIIAAGDEARARVASDLTGETPLEYMLRVMRDTGADEKRRDAMAVAAATFIHPRLSAVDHKGNLNITTHEQALNQLEQSADGGSDVVSH